MADKDYGYGQRPDGSNKGPGFMGELPNKMGGISTELSIGVEFDGQETEIPTLVPTLSKEEVDYMLAGFEPTEEIIDKAVEHARQRIDAGKSPFYGADDEE